MVADKRKGMRIWNGSCVLIWNWKRKSNWIMALSPEEAQYAARRAFGNPTLIREQTRAIWSWNWLESLACDLRFGLRALGRAPSFTVSPSW